MRLYPINAGCFKLDGGAMFGVVPKVLWNKTNPADENNDCTWAMRCLLVETGNRLLLIDNGMGDKQDARFFRRFKLRGRHSLEKSLNRHGFGFDDITDVFLTHLHFDHCGGSIRCNQDRPRLEPAFKNATYWSNHDHWNWALNPNAREKASFLKENILPIKASGRLRFVERGDPVFPGLGIRYANGHTNAMMLPHVNYRGKTVVFVADLIPSTGHIPLPYIMSYDTRPLLTLEEKGSFLNEAADHGYILFLEHDPKHECCTVQRTEKGVRLKNAFSFKECFAHA
ncbi:MAG: MBL fold metallo-hydrolase [Verrucomicrobia bacterium]|nr:MBL fold metallo-hydrolase [Verrucomicrobiota bacterium]